MTTQLPPQDLDAERAVLASLLIAPNRIDEVLSVMQPADCYLDAHREILTAMAGLSERGTPIDHLTLSDALTRRGVLDEIGGTDYLLRLLNDEIPHAAHAAAHAATVRSASIMRQSIYACHEIMRDAYTPHADAIETLTKAADKLTNLLEFKPSTTETIGQIALRSMDRLVAERQSGLMLGYPELDGLTDGLKPGQLVILAARPSVGKTAWAGNVVHNVAHSVGVLFASIEMTNDELFDRMLCARLGISLKQLKPFARNEGGDAVEEHRQHISGLHLRCEDNPIQTVSSITAAARLMKRQAGLGLIVVDYLQLITPNDKRAPREQQVGQIAWGLKCTAKQLGVPVLALAQLNREVEKRADKTPQLSDLRESGAIEQHAAVIMFLDRPAMWSPDKYDEDEATIYLKKNRGGPVGKIDLKWDGTSGTFTPRNDFDVPEVF